MKLHRHFQLQSTFLAAPEDCAWLRDTHLKGVECPEFVIAIIFGNEDCPQAIQLYAENHVNALVGSFVYDETRQQYQPYGELR